MLSEGIKLMRVERHKTGDVITFPEKKEKKRGKSKESRGPFKELFAFPGVGKRRKAKK